MKTVNRVERSNTGSAEILLPFPKTLMLLLGILLGVAGTIGVQEQMAGKAISVKATSTQQQEKLCTLLAGTQLTDEDPVKNYDAVNVSAQAVGDHGLLCAVTVLAEQGSNVEPVQPTEPVKVNFVIDIRNNKTWGIHADPDSFTKTTLILDGLTSRIPVENSDSIIDAPFITDLIN